MTRVTANRYDGPGRREAAGGPAACYDEYLSEGPLPMFVPIGRVGLRLTTSTGLRLTVVPPISPGVEGVQGRIAFQ